MRARSLTARTASRFLLGRILFRRCAFAATRNPRSSVFSRARRWNRLLKPGRPHRDGEAGGSTVCAYYLCRRQTRSESRCADAIASARIGGRARSLGRGALTQRRPVSAFSWPAARVWPPRSERAPVALFRAACGHLVGDRGMVAASCDPRPNITFRKIAGVVFGFGRISSGLSALFCRQSCGEAGWWNLSTDRGRWRLQGAAFGLSATESPRRKSAPWRSRPRPKSSLRSRPPSRR
jgi:hypothetical protein